MSSINRKTLLLGSVAIPMSMLAAQPAVAQDNTEAAEESGGLGEIVVTARKRDETLTNAPVAVTAIGGAELESQGVTGLEQLSARVPGLQVGRAAQTSNVFIRGVGSGINKGFEQSVGMYVDGIYQPRSRQFTQSLFDLQQAEVLRGPQGLLFGKNTVAGAVKVETTNPEIGTDIEGFVGVAWEPEFNSQRYTGAVSAGLGDSAAIRLAGRYTSTDGYVTSSLFDRDEADREDILARLTLVAEPASNFNIEAKVSYSEMDGVGKEATIFAVDPALPTPNTLALSGLVDPDFAPATAGRRYINSIGNLSMAPGGDREELESISGSLKMDWELGPVTLTSVTGLSNFKFLQNHDVDFLPVDFIQNRDQEELDMFSQELRFATDFDGPVNFLGGVYYEKQDLNLNAITLFNGDFGVLPASILPGGLLRAGQFTNFDQNAETIAAFGEASIDLSDTLTLEVGFRYSHDEKDVQKRVAIGTGDTNNFQILVQPEDTIGSPDLPTYVGAAAAAGGADGANAAATFAGLLGRFAHILNDSRSEDHLDPSVKLRWKYSPYGSAYISYSEGYKSGGYNFGPESADVAGNPLPGHEFEDEGVQAWEFGIKHEFGNSARLGFIVFRSDFENLQVTSFNGTAFVVGNAAELRVQGVEVDGQLLITDDLELGGAIAYLDHEFQSFPTAGCSVLELNLATCPNSGGPGTKDLSGQRGSFAPEWSGNAYLDYTRDFDSFTLSSRVTVNFKDEMFLDTDLDPNAYQSGYAKIDAHIGVEFDRFELRVFGRNLTNKATYTASVDAPLSPGVYVGWIEEPRVIGFEGKINF
ncbi:MULTISPECIES: TonB-dependent receptor [unclassified Erythrobacter]|jgi:outer membrane receptor protein involved in Fe transport|uniref:TonB-dependent receptor n=1 Tax=unclassified Erythrobacter TaxID=2633097 RepID=UPI0012697F93|nr:MULTISPECIES: TonB-dependent receptor [unclassified Erythrobacter]QFT77495.1 Pesticin receptor precursor [Erythrobacter sp. THAF29]UAB78093.1 TonB-dependent receptor [Erythrobacter sp. SCSIO 43205]